MSCSTTPLNEFGKRYHLRPVADIRGSSAEAWRKARGSERSRRKRRGRLAEAIGADGKRRANGVHLVEMCLK